MNGVHTMNGERGNAPSRFRFLLDSNVVVAAEPFSGDIEPGMAAAVELLRLANKQGHQLFVAPANKDDIGQVTAAALKAQRLAELGKFILLQEAPVSRNLEARAGSSVPGSNDHRDLRLLALVDVGAVEFLVTEDSKLRSRARNAGLGERALSVADAVELLSRLEPAVLVPPRHVESPECYTLRTDDSLFDGLRVDYGSGFDRWLKKIMAETAQRKLFVINDDDRYAALAILKPEPDCQFEFDGPVMKLCTFKVSDDYSGVKYGELLLNAVLKHAVSSATCTLYVTVLPKHQVLVAFFEDFGFVDSGVRSAMGEVVLVKCCVPDPEHETFGDLQYQVAFGPPALRLRQDVFVVPIRTEWYEQLFPDDPTVRREADASPALFDASRRPSGNALRKAYLSTSSTRLVGPGDVVLFYRSSGLGLVTAVGVVESVVASADPSEVLSFVGRRTVYDSDQVVAMSRSVHGVLAIRFRHDRFVDPGWGRGELEAVGVLNGAPQSITKVPEEGKLWIRQRLGG